MMMMMQLKGANLLSGNLLVGGNLSLGYLVVVLILRRSLLLSFSSNFDLCFCLLACESRDADPMSDSLPVTSHALQ